MKTGRVRAGLAAARSEVARAVSRACRDGHELDDVLQECFFRALRYEHALVDGAPLVPWLVRIARNVVVDRQRAEVGRGHALIEELDEPAEPLGREAEPWAELEPSREVWLHGQPIPLEELRAMLARGRARLAPDDCALLDEHYRSGLTCRESAERRGLTYDAVKVRLFRARHRLRRFLELELRRRVSQPTGRERVA